MITVTFFSKNSQAQCNCPPSPDVTVAPSGLASVYPFSPGDVICLQGDFIIDVNTYFNNNQVYIYEYGQITVNSGITCAVTNGSHLQIASGCTDFWSGVWVTSSTAAINVSNSTIEHASSGVNVSNGATFNISGATFNKNQIAIAIANAPTFTGTIINSKIQCLDPIGNPTGTGLGANPGYRTFTGIDLSISSFATIGSSSQASNIFDNLDAGIVIRNSGATIVNNEFYRMNSPSAYSASAAGFGVRVDNSLAAIIYNITINNNLFGASGKPVYYGIHATGDINLTVKNSTLRNIQKDGIYMESNNSTTNVFKDNTIKNFTDHAIHCFNNPGVFGNPTTINIKNNIEFSNSAGTAIEISEAAGNPYIDLEITDNPDISQVQNGIVVERVRNALIGNNVIDFGYVSGTNNAYGIRLQGGNGSNVLANTVTGTNSASNSKERCIGFDGHRNFYAEDNVVGTANHGFYGNADLSLGNFVCNKINSNYYGIGLEDVTALGPVTGLPANNPSDNCWTPSNPPGGGIYCYGVPGTLGAAFSWYTIDPSIHNVTCLQPTSLSAIGSTAVNLSLGYINGSSACNPPYYKLDSISSLILERETLLGNIVKGKNSFTTFEEENHYRDDCFAYNILKEHPEFLDLDTDEDVLYQDYLALIEQTNIAKFNNLFEIALNGESDAAVSSNNSIVPVNQIETNLQAVAAVYLRTVLLGNKDYSSVDSVVLFDLAYGNSITDGEAVFIARVMLGLDVDASSMAAIEKIIPTSPVANVIYPNPVNNSCILQYDLQGENEGKLIIYDLLGRQINQYLLNGSTDWISLDFGSTLSGLYAYVVIAGEKIITTDNIIVSH